MSQDFRQASQALKNCPDVKKTPTYSDQESCHKTPNYIVHAAYTSTSSESTKKDLMAFAHSSSNIIYSGNNKNHSAMERDLASSSPSAASIRQKGGSIQTSLRRLHDSQSSAATTAVMRKLRASGAGNNAAVANMDKRTFNTPSEKKQIDLARQKAKASTSTKRPSASSTTRRTTSSTTRRRK